MKRLSIFLILYFSITSNSISIEPDVFVQSTVNRASKLLGENISKEQKIEKLKLIAKDTVDIKGIGFYTLSSRLAEYTNPEINVTNKEKLNDNYTIVNSILKATNERPEINIDWRIYTKNKDNPLIRDLIIEGLSLARTQKEEFASVLNSNENNIEALFLVLKEFSDN